MSMNEIRHPKYVAPTGPVPPTEAQLAAAEQWLYNKMTTGDVTKNSFTTAELWALVEAKIKPGGAWAGVAVTPEHLQHVMAAVAARLASENAQ